MPTNKRLLYTLFVTQSLFSAAQIGVFTLMAIVAAQLGGTESVAGLPSSTQTFSQAFAALPVALLMGRFGRRLGLTLGYAVVAVGGLVGVLAIAYESFPLLLICALLFGAGRASAEQSRFAAGEMFPEAERARMIGLVIFAGTIGSICGPLLASASSSLLQGINLDPNMGPWVVMFVVCTLAALITLFLLRPDPSVIARDLIAAEDTARTERGEAWQAARPLGTLLMLPTVQLAIMAVVISQVVMVVLMVMTPLHMHHLQYGLDSISLVITAHTVGMFGFAALTGYLIDKLGRIQMMIVGALILILSALLAPVANSQLALMVALFLLGLGWNFGYVAGASLLAGSLQGTERAKVQGINDTLVSTVAGLGSLSAGPLFASGGYGAVSIAGLLLTLVLVVFIARVAHPKLKATTA
jgi:MFS family permease